MASRSRPTTEWMFRGRARSSKWFVRSCSRSVHWLHWPWSLAKLRQLSAARLRSQLSAARSRLRSAVQLRAVPLQAAPLLAVVALLAAPHQLAVPATKAPGRLMRQAGPNADTALRPKAAQICLPPTVKEPMSCYSWALVFGPLRFQNGPISPNCTFGKVTSFDRFISTATLTTALTGNVYVDTCSNE